MSLMENLWSDEFSKMSENRDPISFVAIDLVTPDTVFFIIRTPEIEIITTPTDVQESEVSRLNFWLRLKKLFVKK